MTALEHAWVEEFPTEITVCDAQGVLIEMNRAAEKVFNGDGGRKLLGSNVLDCHPEPDRTKLEGMLASRQSNAYVNEENGRHMFFYQAAWYHHGVYAGFVELSFEVPQEIPHFIRE